MKETQFARHMLAFLPLACIFLLADSISAQEKKPLRWGADADGGVPYVFKDPENLDKVIGFEVDIANALAKVLGRPIEFVQYDFDTLMEGVKRGDIDIAMNGLEILPERLQHVRFTNPYYIYQLQLVVREGEARFQNLEQAKEKKFSIGTLRGCAAERLLQEMNISTESYQDQDGPYKDLAQSDRVQGVLLDLPAALYYAAPDNSLKYSHREQGLAFAGAPFAEGYYGIAIKKDNAELAAELNCALEELRKSGELKRILERWQLWTADQFRLYSTMPEFEQTAKKMSFWEFLLELLKGAKWTVVITLGGMTLAVLLGLPIALSRLYGPLPIRWVATLYVEFFRGIPVLLLLYFLYFGLPAIDPALKLGPIQAAILGFGLNYAAYEAEIYRAGISSIPVGQWEAAASLGMSSVLTFRRIVLPQAIRVILPPMTNDLVALFKDTSVVSILAVTELSKQYQILTKSGGDYVQIGLTTAALYLIMSVPLGYLSRYLEKRWGAR